MKIRIRNPIDVDLVIEAKPEGSLSGGLFDEMLIVWNLTYEDAVEYARTLDGSWRMLDLTEAEEHLRVIFSSPQILERVSNYPLGNEARPPRYFWLRKDLSTVFPGAWILNFERQSIDFVDSGFLCGVMLVR